MKTSSFFTVFFVSIIVSFFCMDVIGQNDSTDDSWRFSQNNPNQPIYTLRDTALTGGSQRVAIGNNWSPTDLLIQASGPEHGLMVQGGRIGFGQCNGFQQFMTYERDATFSTQCRGSLLFWSDASLNGQGPNPKVSMAITHAGLVGIGVLPTDIPNGYLFSVGGKALMEDLEINLQADWPDYVFDRNYQLPSIEERAAFYNAYRRLPNFQSAVEMDDKLSVHDISIRQQEAIEENAIYITQLHEENKALKKELKEMKQMLQQILMEK